MSSPEQFIPQFPGNFLKLCPKRLLSGVYFTPGSRDFFKANLDSGISVAYIHHRPSADIAVSLDPETRDR
jgi:hypothetical protein